MVDSLKSPAVIMISFSGLKYLRNIELMDSASSSERFCFRSLVVWISRATDNNEDQSPNNPLSDDRELVIRVSIRPRCAGLLVP